jgi:UPF0716 protein FxsA
VRYLILLIIVIPAFEIGLLILSGNLIGVWPTIALIILTGVLGAWLARRQGAEALRLAQIQMQSGQVPGEAILDGISILVGGVVLLTPGFITDATGFFLLIPATRAVAKMWLRRLIGKMINRGNFTLFYRR